jgi:hypothetical protein
LQVLDRVLPPSLRRRSARLTAAPCRYANSWCIALLPSFQAETMLASKVSPI